MITIAPLPTDSPILSCAAMRVAEQAMEARGTSLSELMNRVGAVLADVVWRAAAGRAVLILCGIGNNGGDGYVAARLLRERGADVRLAACSAPTTALARAACEAWEAGGGETIAAIDESLAPAPILVDALFGAGLSRGLDESLTRSLHRLGKAAARIIAVDLPSGVCGDDGRCLSAPLCADVTLALGALKPAHVLLPAAEYCGRILCADIGIDIASAMHTIGPYQPPRLSPQTHKYTRGQVMIIAGDATQDMVGASHLAAAASLRAGAGYVLLSGDATAPPPLQAIVCQPRADRRASLASKALGAVVVGMGMVDSTDRDDHGRDSIRADLVEIFDSIGQTGKGLVCDSCAIGAWRKYSEANRRNVESNIDSALPCPIVTPHAGEFARYFGDIVAQGGSKIAQALAAAQASQAVVIYKGADTIIAAPDGRVGAAWAHCPQLATAGSGDVLAGACGAMLAQGRAPFEAACAAVAWQIAQAQAWRSHTGDASRTAMVADDLLT